MFFPHTDTIAVAIKMLGTSGIVFRLKISEVIIPKTPQRAMNNGQVLSSTRKVLPNTMA
jgi:hypothetical protein